MGVCTYNIWELLRILWKAVGLLDCCGLEVSVEPQDHLWEEELGA